MTNVIRLVRTAAVAGLKANCEEKQALEQERNGSSGRPKYRGEMRSSASLRSEKW